MDNEQFANGSTYISANSNPTNRKTNKKGKLIGFLIIVVLLISVSTIAFANRHKLSNSLAMMSKNPTKYFQHIEKDRVDNFHKLMSKMSGQDTKDTANKISTSLTYDKDTVNALIQEPLGMTIDDLEDMIGISLDSFDFNIITGKNLDKSYYELNFQISAEDLFTLKILLDTLNKEAIAHVPELSPSYLRQSLSAEEIELLNTDLITMDEILELYKKYSYFIIDSIQDVQLIKGEEVTVDDISVKANRINVTISSEEFKKITLSLLTEMKTDELILGIIEDSELLIEDYHDTLDSLIEDLNESSDYSDEDFIEIDIYVDNTGNVIGRNLDFYTANTNSESLGYKFVKKDDKENYEFYLDDSTAGTKLSGKGSHTIDKRAYSGELVIDIITSGGTTTIPYASISLEYKDVELDKINDNLYLNGEFTLSSPLLPVKLILQLGGEDTIRHSEFIIRMGSSNLITLDIKSEELTDFEFPEIPKNADIYEDIDDYLETIDLSGLLSELFPNEMPFIE